MKRLAKILLISLVTICALLVVAITFTVGWRPFLGPRERAVTNPSSSAPRSEWLAVDISRKRC